jgi:hypothetical protein
LNHLKFRVSRKDLSPVFKLMLSGMEMKKIKYEQLAPDTPELHG